MREGLKRRYFWLMKNTLNRGTKRMAKSGRGPFSLVRHVGRKSGRIYETPLVVARSGGGFVVELTYGEDVAWYRNVVAAGECVIIDKRVEYPIKGVESYPTEDGMRAFPPPARMVLKLLKRSEFRFLRMAPAEATAD